MSIFSKNQHRRKADFHSAKGAKECPRLYILASKPTRIGQPDSCEWSFELSIPCTNSTNVATVTAQRPSPLSGLLHYKQKGHADGSCTTVASKNYCCFDRLHTGTHIDGESPAILRICLTSFPPSKNSKKGQYELVQRFERCLERIYTTLEPAVWLDQALLALQGAEIIPPASRGLDIGKFVAFATSYLEQYVRSGEAENSTETKQINYVQIVRENQRLKCMLSSSNTDYTVMNAPDETNSETLDEDDAWSMPVQDMTTTKNHKSWGGFWITHGSEADRSRSSSRQRGQREPWQRGNVYGGLM